MNRRREVLFGLAGLATAGVAYGLEPRRRISLLGGAQLANIVPAQFQGWTSADVSDLVAPTNDGGLEARLYGQKIERVYRASDTGTNVMMLMAWGDSQTNELQLHRPEVCYPSYGFDITNDHPALLPAGGGVTLPGRRLTAVAPDRKENIAYWTRLGEYMPQNGAAQRLDRVKTALAGIIADGLLARFSVVGDDVSAAFSEIDKFIPALIAAMPTAMRAPLVGTARARALPRADGA